MKRSLCHKRRKQAPSHFDFFSDGEEDGSYRHRSRTPPSKSFSYDEDYHHERRNRNLSLEGVGNDAMSKTLNQISRSPFTHRNEGGRLPRWFTQPTFTMYNGRTDPIEHVSHFNQRMTVHSKNKPLMCKVFLSSLRPVELRWFDGLRVGSIDSFKELIQAFRSGFIMFSRVPRPLASLLSLSMREGETLKTYSDKYWEMFNEIDGDFDDVAISTFKFGLPVEHDLKKSLTRKPVTSICQLMDQIDKYKMVEEDQQQDKGKGKVIFQERRDFRSNRYHNNKARKDFAGQSEPAAPQVVNTVYKKSVHQVLEKIKNKPYFRWLNKMSEDPLRHNQSFHCLYHQERGHTTKDYRTLWNHLEQLVKEGRLQQFLYRPNGQGDQSRT